MKIVVRKLLVPWVMVAVSGIATPASAALRDDATPWQSIGPYSVGGEMTTFPSNGQRMIATAQNSRYYFETLDRGGSWQVRDRIPVGDGQLLKVLADPSNDQRMWAVLVSAGRDPTYSGRIYASNNAGGKWGQLPAPDRAYLDLDVDPSGTVLVATSWNALSSPPQPPAVHISRDGGQTWVDSGVSSTAIGRSGIAGHSLYLSTREGVVRIADIRDPASPPELIFTGSGGEFAWMRNVDAGPAVVVADSQFDGVWASTDQGATWRRVRPFRLGTALVKVWDGEIIVCYTDQIHLSQDFGATWKVLPDPSPTTFAIDALRWGTGDTAGLYPGEVGAGIYRLDQGGGAKRGGSPGSAGLDLVTAARPGGGPPVLAVGTRYDVFRTTLSSDGGGSVSPDWGDSEGAGVIGRAASKLAASNGVLYKVLSQTHDQIAVYRSDDGGASWRQVAAPDDAVVIALLAHPASASLVAVSVADLADGYELRVSTDGGTTWRRTSLKDPLLELAGDPQDPARLYGVGPTGLWVSDDAGVSFRRVNTQPGEHLAASPFQPGRLVLSHLGSIFSSADGGQTLRLASGVDPALRISDLAYSPTSPSVVMASARDWIGLGEPHPGDVLRSDDAGGVWRSVGLDLPVRDLVGLAFHPSGRQVYALSAFGGTYRLSL